MMLVYYTIMNLAACSSSYSFNLRGRCIRRRIYRVIVTVGIEVEAADEVGRDIVHAVGIEEPANLRVVIARLQIVQARLHVVVVPAVAEGVDIPDKRAARVFRAAGVAHLPVAPGVVHILGDDISALVYQRDDVPLEVFLHIVQRTIVGDGGNAGLVVGVNQSLSVAALFFVDAVAFGKVGGRNAVFRLALAHAARIVGEGCAAILFELPSTLPL